MLKLKQALTPDLTVVEERLVCFFSAAFYYRAFIINDDNDSDRRETLRTARRLQHLTLKRYNFLNRSIVFFYSVLCSLTVVYIYRRPTPPGSSIGESLRLTLLGLPPKLLSQQTAGD